MSKNVVTLHSFNGMQSTIEDNEGNYFLGNCRSVDTFEKLDRIGEGTYGVVFALKKIRMENEVHGVPLSSLREIILLKSLRHENIVQVKQVAVGTSLANIFMVMEFVEQDLALLMESSLVKPFKKSEIKCLMSQLLNGVAYLHSLNIIHRGILKIADFGMARRVEIPLTPDVVTLWYRAPEMLYGLKEYSYPADMWSVGCIFAEWIQKRPMFPGSTVAEQVAKISAILGPPDLEWDDFKFLPYAESFIILNKTCQFDFHFSQYELTEATRNLLKRLLCYDPKKRADVQAAISHEYFFEEPPKCSPAMLPTYPEIRSKLHPVQLQ